jgi:RNA polymerase sigma-54 factor
MALSVGLQMRQSQSLVMTPQLMQSIRLLQFSHVELLRFVEEEIERNPLLEMASEDGAAPAGDGDGEVGEPSAPWDEAAADRSAAILAEQIDATYENVFQDDHGEGRVEAPEFVDNWKSMPGVDGARAGEFHDVDDYAAQPTTLKDHIAEQIAFAFPDSAERLIATEIADLLDPAGYLEDGIEETAARLGAPQEKVDEILDRLQKFDPPGLFARSLGECLALQLVRKDRFDPAMAALVDHLELLARRDFQALSRICGVGEEDLLDMLAEIRALDPKPGLRFETGHSEIVVPDVLVRQAADGGWLVELNADTMPRLLVNQSYYARVSGTLPKDGGGQDFLSECLQTANWLIRSLDQRARTILKVATEIVRRQDAFLVHGVEHLRPLNLKTVAEAIGMHESTVSRVTSNKFMMTPRGVFELKYFFTVSIAAADGAGDAHSAEAVRNRIRTLIEQESPLAVLSDDDLVDRLREAGIEIARRTVAKYREAMAIPSSVQRRREKRARANAAAAAG